MDVEVVVEDVVDVEVELVVEDVEVEVEDAVSQIYWKF